MTGIGRLTTKGAGVRVKTEVVTVRATSLVAFLRFLGRVLTRALAIVLRRFLLVSFQNVGISEDMFAHFPPTFTRERWDEIMGLILGRSAVDIRQDALEKRIDEAKSKHAGDEAAAAKANIRILCSMAAPTNARAPPPMIIPRLPIIFSPPLFAPTGRPQLTGHKTLPQTTSSTCRRTGNGGLVVHCLHITLQ